MPYIPAHVGSPFDVIGVPGVVSLHLVVHVIQHHHAGDEVDHLTSRQQVQVVTTVLTAVPVTEVQLVKDITIESLVI